MPPLQPSSPSQGSRPQRFGRERSIGRSTTLASDDGQPDDDAFRQALPTSRPACRPPRSSLSRVGVTGVEKVIRVKGDDGENLFHADFECFVDLNPRQAGVHMSRFEEIVGEAIDEVVLGEAFKAEVLAAHIAQRVRERQGGLRAEVSVDGPLPGDGDDPGERPEDPGDLRPLRHRGRLRAGHADADRRPGPGHDRLPLRPGDGRRALPRTARRAGLRARGDRARRSSRSRSPPTTSAASAPSTSAAPRAAESGSTRPSCCGSSRAR